MSIESAETRLRLLETATQVFAEHGYATTTIRMICGRAKVNVAAVNYHFGSKEHLYREVLRYARQRAYEKYPLTYGLEEGATPEQRLRAFVHSFLLRNFGDVRNLGFGTLTMREMVEPTSALDMIVDEGIRSLFEHLVAIVRAILGEDADEELVQACSRSTIGQCTFYLFSRTVMNRMAPEQQFGAEDVERITDQIMLFTLHALRGLSGKKTD
ncbi:MAG: transcriptional regulator, TetR family [Geobacteraceae bacterium]|nr:transcriptional regulator, TetR family [Geobacteraceae bacterium]